MSGFEDDIELSRLQEAATFMRQIRMQASNGKAQTGGNFLKNWQKREITKSLSESALIAQVKKAMGEDFPVNHLAERFEEMCRRVGTLPDAELRPYVVKMLSTELLANKNALKCPAKTLIAGTLHQGAIAPELLQEFPKLPSYVIVHAFAAFPADPRAFVQHVQGEIVSIAAEAEFQSLAPSRITAAALNFPWDARERLRRQGEMNCTRQQS